MLDSLKNLSEGIAIFIRNYLIDNGSFKYRSFYGESFSFLLLEQTKFNNLELTSILLNEYDKKNKEGVDFHFEFNNYAFLNILKLTENDEIKKRLYPLRFRNTECTNWTLLRLNTKIQLGVDLENSISRAKSKISKFQLSSGLILDDKGVKSFQYHCFSMAMIAEIYESTKEVFFLKSFNLGVDFIRNFILPNGKTLYIGRGQEQSFGYGALIYILSLYYKYNNDGSVISELNLIIEYLLKFKLEEGNFPLVMNDLSKELDIDDVDLNKSEFAGWYQYNNYFDYLPFMGVFINKAVKVLNNLELKPKPSNLLKSYSDSNFKKIVNKKYISIISKSGGYWTNDLTIPLIFSNEKCITPIYGGDQFAYGLPNIKALPLPYFHRIGKSIRWFSYSRLIGNNLILLSPLGIMLRSFKHKDTEIRISTMVFSLFKANHHYFMLKRDADLLNLKSSKEIFDLEGDWVSPDGLLKGFYTKGFRQNLSLKLIDES